LSFLNIGSGTGYLSSMVGLILGSNGVNHNIELHKELVEYSKEKISQLIKTSPRFDDFEFCVPKIIHGNFMNLNLNNDTILYDRIYVGACVSEQHEHLVTSLLKNNGILIMPINDSLVKIKKIDENTFSRQTLMNVSFASLITTNENMNELFRMPRLNPFSLQEICRFKIRQLIRQTIENDCVDYYKVNREKSTFNKRKLPAKQFDLNEEEHNDSGEENDDDDQTEATRQIEFPITRFERMFSTEYTRVESRNNHNLENQLRLMIYGHLLDAASSSLQFAVNSNENEEPADQTSNSTAASSESQTILLNEESESSIQFTKSCTIDGSEANMSRSSESEEESSLHSSSDKAEPLKRKRNFSSGYSTSSTELSPAPAQKEISHDSNQESQHELKTLSDSTEKNETQCVKSNLLREKILSLNVSKDLKKFLLYYREV